MKYEFDMQDSYFSRFLVDEVKEEKNEFQEGYKIGFNKGFQEGFKIGFNIGFQIGIQIERKKGVISFFQTLFLFLAAKKIKDNCYPLLIISIFIRFTL